MTPKIEHKRLVLRGMINLLRQEIDDEQRCLGNESLKTQRFIIENMLFVLDDIEELVAKPIIENMLFVLDDIKELVAKPIPKQP
jgi:hypothetical protein